MRGILVAGAAALALCSGVGGANAVLPGANGKIAFQNGYLGASYLYVVEADGSRVRQITDTYSANPSWSPDGTRLAFEGLRGSTADVFTVNADGTSPRQLTFSVAFDGDPAWSPSGARIAFESTRTHNSDIWTMAAGGGDERQLTTSAAFDGDPAWSPDGTRIAFTTLRDGNYEIYVMNADATGVTRLTNDGGAVPNPTFTLVDQNPSWSPDGRRILFDSNRTGNFDVFVMNADGTGQTNLTNHPALDALATFSPDGRRIVFTSDRSGGDNRDLYSMTPTGGSVTRLTSTAGWDMAADWQRPARRRVGRGCTERGTNGPDVLRGTLGPDRLCGLKGSDRLFGRGGNDVLDAGAGNDVLYGESGKDMLLGGDGNDVVYARDGRADRIVGGRGRDRAIVDRVDVVLGVERVERR